MMNVQEAIEAWKDFEQRATEKRSEQINRIKADRKFLAGDQWESVDDKLISRNRPRRTINIISNSVNSVVNQYANYPFKWYNEDNELNSALEGFLKTRSNNRASYDVLRSDVSFGLGYFALGSESITDSDGTKIEIPSLYSVDRVENVYYDPDSVDIDGADAVEAALIECRSKNWVRAKYGEEWVTGKGVRPVVNVTDNHDADVMVIVTYFRVEDGRCSVYRLLNNDFLEEPVQLNISRVPVFPVYGERSWNDSEPLWQGLVRKGTPIQKLVNYAYTQLAERMAIAPKPIILTTPEAVEGYDDGYRNISNNLNPLALWNPTSPDGKVKYEKPEFIPQQVNFGDITGIIGSNLELLASITGVDSRGIVNGEQMTATEVIYNEKQVQSTIRHYFANLRDTFKAVGETVAKLLGFGDVTLDVIQGPDEYMEKQVARQELVALAGLVPDDAKMKIVDGILLSHNDNTILRNVFGALHAAPQPTAMEAQAFETIEQMKAAIEQKNGEIEELKMNLRRYEMANENSDKSIRADFAKMDLQHQHKMEEMALQAELDAGGDAVKAGAEAEKARLDLEKTAVQLDATKVKAAADIAKTIQPMIGGGM